MNNKEFESQLKEMETKISQCTIEESIRFYNILVDDSKWKECWDGIIPKKNGSIYEELKYYYNKKYEK